MNESCAVMRYEQAAALLPPRLECIALHLADYRKALAEELRLRVGQPMTVLLPEGEWMIDAGAGTVRQAELEQLVDQVTEYSRYAAATMGRGYVTGNGGFRVGLGGTAVMERGRCIDLRDISSACVRIAREKTGISDDLMDKIAPDGVPENTLIIAPPGAGKTTILRDIIRNLSNGTGKILPQRVAVVDERSELAAVFHGEPQLDVGCHTDVIDGCPKAEGIMMMLRSVGPQVIAVDEITAREDIQAMEMASRCGVKLLASIHAADVRELQEKHLFSTLLAGRVFTCCIVIRRGSDGKRYYRVEHLC